MTVGLRGVVERQLCVLPATCERRASEIECTPCYFWNGKRPCGQNINLYRHTTLRQDTAQMKSFCYGGLLLRGNRTLNMRITQLQATGFDLLQIMADITIKGISCSHQSIATAGWRGPNPFKRWFGSILPALAKHCGSRCGRDCLKGGTQLHCSNTKYHLKTRHQRQRSCSGTGI